MIWIKDDLTSASRTRALRRLAPFDRRRRMAAPARFDLFAKPTMNDRYLRAADDWSRRRADMADRRWTPQLANSAVPHGKREVRKYRTCPMTPKNSGPRGD